jgi:hypothetical protein
MGISTHKKQNNKRCSAITRFAELAVLYNKLTDKIDIAQTGYVLGI